jgi:hypothetical protein
MEHNYGRLSIWFFIGLLLAVYGVLICGAGIYGYYYPSPGSPVVLAEVHMGIWWGALLFIVGLTYVIRFYPKKPN